jgi:hypothetical protein
MNGGVFLAYVEQILVPTPSTTRGAVSPQTGDEGGRLPMPVRDRLNKASPVERAREAIGCFQH